MTKVGSEIIDVIQKFAALEWGRCSLVDSSKEIDDIPLSVWRFNFQKTDAQLADQIILTLQSILRDFSSNVNWTFEKPEFSVEGRPGRNWVLIPTRLKEMDDSGRFRTDVEARIQLYNDDPSFGSRAYEDLVKIAQTLEERLSILKVNNNQK